LPPPFFYINTSLLETSCSINTFIMRTFITIAAALFAGVASATNSQANAFKNPSGGYTFTAGEPTTLSWNADAGTTVTLRLQYGAVSTANSGTIIACEYLSIFSIYITHAHGQYPSPSGRVFAYNVP
jgi:hypothetical protein